MNTSKQKKPCVLMMAGGTGGHVFPALAVALALRTGGYSVVWLGTAQGLEAEKVKAAGFPIETIVTTGLYGKTFIQILKSLSTLGYSLIQAFKIFWRVRPRLAIGMGGYVTGPGGLVAWLLRVPLVIHEQNVIPGFTNRCLARFAIRSLEGFIGTYPAATRKVVWTGNPVRIEIENLSRSPLVGESRGGFRLLVLGGSLGAETLNEKVPQALSLLGTGERPLVWHQTGKGKNEKTEKRYAEGGVKARVDAFIEDMAAAYKWATIVICRAGALTVTELMAAGKGAIVVPFPYAANDHQSCNAAYLQRVGAAIVVEQKRLTPEVLAEQISHLMARPERVEAMAKAARRNLRADATERVVKECVSAMAGRAVS